MSEAERIGQRLRTLRVGRGLTQAQVGEGAGFTAKYVSEIERGARPDLPLSTLEAIVVQGLGGSVSELFGDSRRGKTKHALPQSIESLAYDLARIRPTKRSKIVAVIRGLLRLVGD